VRITDAKVVVCSPGRNYVSLLVSTDEGLSGIGDATLNGRELAVASYLRDHVCPLLVGRDPLQTESTWQYLYRGAYWRRGPVTMTAIGAVDVALWDIKAKLANLPLYQLLGGASRSSVLVYSHASGQDVPELLDDVSRLVEEGYQAVRVQVGSPAATYGVRHGPGPYEPAASSYPVEQIWDTPSYLASVPPMLEAVRERFGPGLHLLHDAHHRLTPLEAAQLGRSVEPYKLWWLEDPTPSEDQTAFRLVRQHTVTPLAVGEVFSSIWDCQTLISERLIDFVRASVAHAGGITHLRRILSFAELYGARSGCHGASDLSPVALAAMLHLDLAVPNFGIQEHMGHPGPWQEVFHVSYQFSDGSMHPGGTPGLGVELDEKAAARYPYEPRYLPVARLADGTVHDW